MEHTMDFIAHKYYRFSDLTTSKLGDHWVYLNGHVGFGGSHQEIIPDLALRAGVDEGDRLTNLVAAGFYPETQNDLALGVLRNNRPHIQISNVDRNAVVDKVREHMV